MLRLLEPVVLEQALELRIEIAVITHTFDIVPLRHPFDVQDRDRDTERFVCEDLLRDRRRRSDDLALRSEVRREFLAEYLEELDVLSFLACELKKRTHAVIVVR